MKIVLISFIAMLCLTGCTHSITIVYSEGPASDVIDETATNSPSLSLVPTYSPRMPSL